MAVISAQVGATTQNSAVVVTEVDSGADVRLAVSTDPGLAEPVFYGPVTPQTQGTHFVAKVTATDLNPLTRYFYRVEHDGTVDTVFPGEVRTHPVPNTPASFTVGAGACAGSSPEQPGVGAVLDSTRMSNHTVFETARSRAVAEDWLAFFHLGDEHYYDLLSGAIPGGTSLANYRRAKSDVLLQPNQHGLYRSITTVKIADDHDFLDNNTSGSADPAGAANWAQAEREREPHYPLETTEGVYFSHLIGRVLFVVLDSRFYASPNSDPDDENKTMLGADQKTWLRSTLAGTAAKFIVVVMSRQWTRSTGDDTWASFTTERDELADMFTGLGVADRMCMVWGDRHAIKLMDTQPFGGFPCIVAASFDSAFGTPTTDYPDGEPDEPGRNQYGTLSFDDDGQRIVVTMSTWRGVVQHDTLSFTVQTPSLAVIPSQTVMQSLSSGSHRMAVEARVVPDYHDGDDPPGTEIPILAGGVVLDSTADIHGSLALVTDGDGTWPQRASSLLSPFGNEIFVRRGIHINGQTLWIPLGYYRIQDPDQADAPDGPITITGLDRMAGLIDARLLAPRQYMSNRTVHTVFDELVREIYPAATILFDDSAVEFAELGRTIESEDSRYELLREVATSFGKIMYWDTSGVLRVETAPDAEQPRWSFIAGRRNGVLISASRSLSREGVYNAVVVTGEGASGETDPVRAVAFDNNATSPTYFFGRFGQVPRFYSSPLITNQAQAINAARSLLRRNMGFPYNVAFTISPNPAVRPWDPIQVMFGDGKREVHVVETISIPLEAAVAMVGATREQTRVVIGET